MPPRRRLRDKRRDLDHEEEQERGSCYYLGAFWLWLVLFVITLEVYVPLMGYVAYTYRVVNPQLSILADRSFEWMPRLDGTYYSTIIIYSYVFVFAAIILIWSPWGVFALRRLLCTWVPILVLRGCIIWVTSYPDPSSGCTGADPLGATANDVWGKLFLGQSCGDLMFSGHTSAAVEMFLTSVQAFPTTTRVHLGWTIFLYIFSGLWAVTGIVFITIERLHYTADVLVAIVIGATLWAAVNGTLTRVRVDQWGRHALCRCLPWCERDMDMPLDGSCGCTCYKDVHERLYCYDEREPEEDHELDEARVLRTKQ